MTKTFKSVVGKLQNTEGTIYTAPSDTLTMLVQATNVTSDDHICEVWVATAGNVDYYCLIPQQTIAAYDGIKDDSKHIIPSGYKIIGSASASNVIYLEVSVLEGM